MALFPLFYLFVLVIGSLLPRTNELWLAGASWVIFAVCVVLVALFAPVEVYRDGALSIGMNGKRAGAGFWLFFICIVAAIIGLLLLIYGVI